jgi:hypothetical protein
VRSSGTYATVQLEDLLEMDPEGKRKHPTPPSKTYTELDADPIKLFPDIAIASVEI